MVNQNEKGEIVPGVATQWKSMTTVSGLLPCAITQNGRMAHGNGARFCLQLAASGGPENATPFAWFAALAGINNAQAIIDVKLRLTSLASPQLMPIP